jgi:hypothetical protein
MTIWHDAYLFDTAGCVAAVEPWLDALERDADAAYPKLRHEALALVRRSAKLRRLLDRHGGWDEAAMLGQLPAMAPQEPADSAFWLMCLVYRALSSRPPGLGLGTGFRALEQALSSAGWSEDESGLLVHGHALERLFMPRSGGVLAWLHPASQDGRAGWLGAPEAAALRLRLEETGARHGLDAQPEGELARAYRSARRYLAAAEAKGSGLCLITSG